MRAAAPTRGLPLKLHVFGNGWLRLILVVALAAFISGCGSGAVTGPPPATAPLSVTPSAATLYSEFPTAFTISGGSAPYFVTSSDQATVPVIGNVSGSTFTVVPNPVAAETPVTLTVTDSASNSPVTVGLTVRPRIVSNVVTVTPSASQSAACGTAICAGGDAEVKVTLSQNGIPLQGRTVRFEAVSGDFALITSGAGAAETLANSATAVSDSTGTARVRIRVLTNASAQTALLQITDVSSGSFQRIAVPIAPSSSSPLNAQPGQISFTGPNATSCATGISADVIVFGGRPPYSISRPGTVLVDRDVVTANGGRFTVTATGQCVDAQPIAIVDNNGSSVSVLVSNSLGAVRAGTPLTATPATVTLEECHSIATVTLAGGNAAQYIASSGSGAVMVTKISGSQFQIQRRTNTPPITPTTGTVEVGFSDGQASVPVTVQLAPVPC